MFPLHLQSIDLAGTPVEIFVPDPAAVKAAYERGAISFPYWSQVWPSAKALAQFLFSNPFYVAGHSVVELGAGLGLPSLVAARYAASVLCTDYMPEAVAAVQQSALYHQLQNCKADVLDWQRLPEGMGADVLLLSDINYEPVAFDTLQKVIAAFLQKGTTVLLATPQRLVAKAFVAPLLASCIHQDAVMVQHQNETVPVSLLVLQQ